LPDRRFIEKDVAMVMAKRPEVKTTSASVSTIDTLGLAQQMLNALARVPFRPLPGGYDRRVERIGASVTREVMRTFMGYCSALPIEEFRSLELLLDDLCHLVMAPVVALQRVTMVPDTLGGVPGVWYRPRGSRPAGHMFYIHGGGHIGTSPTMYAYFTAVLANVTGCEVFVSDYRLAPEFPFPAGLEDAVAVARALLERDLPADRLVVAGDSGGAGTACSLMYEFRALHLPRPGGLVLFSPEADLRLDQPSVTQNAAKDILPWNIPTSPFLHGTDPGAAIVSAIDQDVECWPPTLVAYGQDEMLRDSIRILVQHLRNAEVDTVSIEAPGMFHVFPILMPWAAASRDVQAELGRFVRRQLGHGGERVDE
jgi:epsilon-lactone hydrolase